MTYGKPIIHIYYSDNDVNLTYLNRYPLSLCIKAEDSKIEENSKLLIEWCEQHKNRVIVFDYVKDIFCEMTPEYIVNIIRKI